MASWIKKPKRTKKEILEKAIVETRVGLLAQLFGNDVRKKFLISCLFLALVFYCLSFSTNPIIKSSGSIFSHGYDSHSAVSKFSKNELKIAKESRVNLNSDENLSVERKLVFIKLLGILIYCLVLAIIFLLCLKLFAPEVLMSTSEMTIFNGLVLSVPILTRLILEYFNSVPLLLIPAAIPAVIICIVYNVRVAIIGTAASCFLAAGVAGNDLAYGVVMFSGAIAAVLVLSHIKHRTDPLRAGFISGFVYFITAFAFGIYSFPGQYKLVFLDSVLGIVNGLFIGLLLASLLPFIEKVFGVLTDIRLLEYSDQNQDLLKMLVLSAPNTYAHSVLVGNLAEAASKSIGANALLAKVGAFYHDIGKMTKPQYFAENIADPKQSRHNQLTPAMSTLIIMAHVKDGLEIAEEYRLPKQIIDFIGTHHGTSLVEYFFRTAMDEKEEHELVEESSFRYSGPQPHTRETGIVLLADSVEAASRALSEPTPQRIRNMVRNIISNKLNDHQLDSSPLTLKELKVIEDSFVRILTSMFHLRPKYPDQEEKLEDKKEENLSE